MNIPQTKQAEQKGSAATKREGHEARIARLRAEQEELGKESNAQEARHAQEQSNVICTHHAPLHEKQKAELYRLIEKSRALQTELEAEEKKDKRTPGQTAAASETHGIELEEYAELAAAWAKQPILTGPQRSAEHASRARALAEVFIRYGVNVNGYEDIIHTIGSQIQGAAHWSHNHEA